MFSCPGMTGAGWPTTSSHAEWSSACASGVRWPLRPVSASTLGVIENELGWSPGSCRRILAGGEPILTAASEDGQYSDPTLRHLANSPGLPPDVVRGLIALARTWREGDDGT